MDWGFLIGALLLVIVGVFIVWDSRRMRAMKPAPLSRDTMEKGVTPGRKARWQALIVLALVFGIAGIGLALKPNHPPFTGKFSPLYNWAYAVGGEKGPAGIWFAFALVCALAAHADWRGKFAKR